MQAGPAQAEGTELRGTVAPSEQAANAWPEAGNPIYECLFEHLPQAVALLDGRLRVELANRAASALFQIAPAELIGLPITALVPCEDLARCVLDLGEKPVKVIEIQPLAQESVSARILRITIVPLPGNGSSGGREPGFDSTRDPGGAFRLLLLEDVTETRRMQDQLVETEKLVAMGQLASGIAHELANPLSSMSSNLQYVWEKMSRDGDLTLVDAVEVTLEHLDQMRRLLRSLLDFTGQHRAHYEMVNVGDLIRRKLAFIGKEAEQQGVEVTVGLKPSLPPCHLDVRMIGQALLNLLKNALEAMPHGGRLNISARPANSTPDGDSVIIAIEDTGAGIEEAEMRRVFRPLYSTKPRGTGLGLAFCRQVIEEHGGEIHLASQKGHGTTVTLTLPVHQEEAGTE